jgi:transmembrane sensor
VSALNAEAQTQEGAEALAKQAAVWIERRDFGDWSDEDRAGFKTWLAQSPAHRVAFLRADARWGRTAMLGALRPFRTEDAQSAMPWRSRIPFARGAAALVLVALTGASAAFYLTIPRETTYATAIGGHKTIALADGSHVELNTNTVLRIGGRDNRTISLVSGEAYFEVKHDPAHPFVVTASAHRVTDLGTKFLVRSDADRLTVLLMEGRASIQSDGANQTQPTMLTPGDIAVAVGDKMSVTRKPALELAREIGWRHGVLVFDNTTLAEAAAELNRYNRQKIVIADASVAKLTIVGTFPENDVEAVADAAKEVFGLQVQNRKDAIVISR